MPVDDIILRAAVILIALYLIYDKYRQMREAASNVKRKLCQKCNTYNALDSRRCGWCGSRFPFNKPAAKAPAPKPAPEPEIKVEPTADSRQELISKSHELIAKMDEAQLNKLIAFSQGVLAGSN